jgi:hypothetical protein
MRDHGERAPAGEPDARATVILSREDGEGPVSFLRNESFAALRRLQDDSS